MSYLKFKANLIFTGTKILHDNYVLITTEQGIVEDIVEEKDAGGDIQNFRGLLTPGFINCHCHIELSHLKGVIPNGTGLITFLITVMQQRIAGKKEIHEAINKAEQELYNNGTVAIGDICNTTDTIPLKQKSELYYYNFIEVLGFSESNAEERFAVSKKVYDQFEKLHTVNFKFQTSFAPHAPYSVSNTLFKLLNNQSCDKTIAIHNQECAAEEELYKKGSGDFYRFYKTMGIDSSSFKYTGRSSLPTCLPFLDKARNIILVHNTYATQEDIEFAIMHSKMYKQELYWCLCPNANLYIEKRLPAIDLFVKNNCNIVLGTDSYSSNRSLNILDEIKRIQQNFNFDFARVLQWATINGAKALQMDETLGSFEKGKQPGIVLIDEIKDQNISKQSTVRRII